jgi:hypothetical protein
MTKHLSKIIVQDTEISFMRHEVGEYISSTDIAKYRNFIEPFSVINNWMRSRSTIEFLGLWEKLNNPDFKPIEFDRFKNEAGNNYFVLSPQRWIESTNAVLIHQKLKQNERLMQLNKIAITQMKSLLNNLSLKKLK